MLTLKYTFKDGSTSIIKVSENIPLMNVSACGKDVEVEILSYEPGATITAVMG